MRQLQLGDTTVHAVTDCAPAPVAAAQSFPNADFATRPDLAARWFPKEQFTTRFCVFVLRTHSRTIVIDCGLGPGDVAYFPGMRGNLMAELHEIGIAPAQVDTVVFTHLHIDHVGWAGAFRNARFIVAKQEWAHWSQNGDAAGLPHHVHAVKTNIMPLAKAGRLVGIEADEEIAPGVTLFPAQGHTPGHHGVLIRSPSATLLIAGDTWHNPAQVTVPAWSHRADMNRDAAIANRRTLAEWASSHECIVAAGHFAEEACFGHVVRHDGGTLWHPIA